MNMAKRLLFLGGGRSNIGAIQTAKKMGIECYVAGILGDYPCNKYADKLIDVNMMDKYATHNAVKDMGIDGVLICCSDKALETCGYLCDKLNLPGISEYSAILSSNKYAMKQALTKGGVKTAKFMKVRNESDIKEACSVLSFPLMVKAVDLQGSKGVYKAENEAELWIYYRQVCLDSYQNYCIVEEFIDGIEMGAQAFVYKGEVLFVQPHGDIISHFGSISAPTGHYTPVALSDEAVSSIENEAQKAIKAIGLNNCAVNMDFILKDGVPYFLELTGRVGANCLPMMMSYYWGFDYYQMIVSMAIGLNPKDYFNPIPKKNLTLTKMITSSVSGVVKSVSISGEAPYYSMFISSGSDVHTFRNANDCIGELLCQGDSLLECEMKSDEFMKSIKIELI